jgi:hypothetical protein
MILPMNAHTQAYINVVGRKLDVVIPAHESSPLVATVEYCKSREQKVA